MRNYELPRRQRGLREDITHHMKFNKSKCQILHLGCGSPGYMYKLGVERLGSSPAERNLGVWVDGSLNMYQQCALAAQKSQPCRGVYQPQIL